jgi:hypothetical protein
MSDIVNIFLYRLFKIPGEKVRKGKRKQTI